MLLKNGKENKAKNDILIAALRFSGYDVRVDYLNETRYCRVVCRSKENQLRLTERIAPCGNTRVHPSGADRYRGLVWEMDQSLFRGLVRAAKTLRPPRFKSFLKKEWCAEDWLLVLGPFRQNDETKKEYARVRKKIFNII